MSKGQSKGQGWVGPFATDDAETPREQTFAKRGQSAAQDCAGPYSKEVAPRPPEQKVSNRKFNSSDQGWCGPYTDNKGWDD